MVLKPVNQVKLVKPTWPWFQVFQQKKQFQQIKHFLFKESQESKNQFSVWNSSEDVFCLPPSPLKMTSKSSCKFPVAPSIVSLWSTPWIPPWADEDEVEVADDEDGGHPEDEAVEEAIESWLCLVWEALVGWNWTPANWWSWIPTPDDADVVTGGGPGILKVHSCCWTIGLLLKKTKPEKTHELNCEIDL